MRLAGWLALFVSTIALALNSLHSPPPVEAQFATPTPLPPCPAQVDKTASPTQLSLVDTALIQLTFRARCDPVRQPVSLMLVLDRSQSMRGLPLTIEKTLALDMLARLDPRFDHAGLVSFSFAPTLDVGLTHETGIVAGAVTALRADGVTNVAGAINLAATELLGVNRAVYQKPTMLIMSDGGVNDYNAAVAAAVAARANGIAIFAIGVPGPGALPDLVSQPDYYIELQGSIRETVERLESALITYQTRRVERVTIEDELSARVRLVPDSPSGPATVNGQRIRWELPFATEGLTVTYHVQPVVTGVVPVSTRAVATYTDNFTTTAQLVFPVLLLNVSAPSPTPSPTWTPSVTTTPTRTPTATPTRTATITPSPTATATTTRTFTVTPTTTRTVTPTPSPSATATATATASPSVTVTPTLTATPPPTPSPTPRPVYYYYLPYVVQSTLF